MTFLKDRSFKSSKTSLEFKIIEVESISSKIKIIFNSGEHQLEFEFLTLRDDIEMIYELIFNHWDELLKGGVWDATDPSFSFSIFENKSEIINDTIYRFQFWIDAGEFNCRRSTRSGIGITIYQDRETIEKFALQLKKELE